MKKFRFATIHLIMMGMILFGLLAICIKVVHSNTLLLGLIFLVLLFVIGLLWYQKQTYELSELEQIEILNDQTEVSLKNLLDKMPVGVIQFDQETQDIEWFNPYAELIFTTESGDFNSELVQEIIDSKCKGEASPSFQISGNKYSSYVDINAGIFYFFDVFVGNREIIDNNMLRPVIVIISIDNYDDVIDNYSDTDVSQINGFIANFISDFASARSIFYRRVSTDRFYFFTDYHILKELMDSKFDIVETFRNESQEKQFPLTLSMGISFGNKNHLQIGKVALENLNIASVRGGDQIVVRENDDNKKPLYFGGCSVSTVKRSRTRTRAMMSAISDRIKMVDKVFIVGHRNIDMDALGSAVGMQFFSSNVIEQSYVVYNPEDMNPDIERAIDSIQKDGKTRLISVAQAMGMVTSQSLLVMVDHSKISLTLSEEFYRLFTDVVIVDHHRRDNDFPENAVLSFIESGASSAAELVTELIQFQNAKTKLSKIKASVVMAGIMLDTKNFSTRVTSRTFDVASYLRSLGSDSVEIQTISAIDFDEYRQVNELILRGNRLTKDIIVASGDNEIIYTKVMASKAADTMLSMAGIEATFVIARISEHKIAISARSRSKINVQRIMEKMGGGGHFNLAACQLEDITAGQAKDLLISTIENTMKETMEDE